MKEEPIPTYEKALAMLAAKAVEGSVTAIVALERALRNRPPEEHDELSEMIDEILARDD